MFIEYIVRCRCVRYFSISGQYFRDGFRNWEQWKKFVPAYVPIEWLIFWVCAYANAFQSSLVIAVDSLCCLSTIFVDRFAYAIALADNSSRNDWFLDNLRPLLLELSTLISSGTKPSNFFIPHFRFTFSHRKTLVRSFLLPSVLDIIDPFHDPEQ